MWPLRMTHSKTPSTGCCEHALACWSLAWRSTGPSAYWPKSGPGWSASAWLGLASGGGNGDAPDGDPMIQGVDAKGQKSYHKEIPSDLRPFPCSAEGHLITGGERRLL